MTLQEICSTFKLTPKQISEELEIPPEIITDDMPKYLLRLIEFYYSNQHIPLIYPD